MSDFQLGYPCAKCGLYGMHHCEGDANLAASDDRARDFWERCVLACLGRADPNMSVEYAERCADLSLVEWRKRFDPRGNISILLTSVYHLSRIGPTAPTSDSSQMHSAITRTTMMIVLNGSGTRGRT